MRLKLGDILLHICILHAEHAAEICNAQSVAEAKFGIQT